MTGPQGAGTFMPTLALAPSFTTESTEDFTTNAGTWDWDLFNSQFLSTDLGAAQYSIAAGKLVATNINASVLADDIRASATNMWGSIENQENLTSGGVRHFRVYINFSRFANNGPASAGYYGIIGWDGEHSFVSLGKTWNGTDIEYQRQYTPIPIGSVMRLRHDGVGGAHD